MPARPIKDRLGWHADGGAFFSVHRWSRIALWRHTAQTYGIDRMVCSGRYCRGDCGARRFCPQGQRASQAFRTPDGQPDLQGVWRVNTITPLERPAEFVDKPFLTPQEASTYQAGRLAALNLDTSAARAGLNGPSVNEF